MLEQLGMSTTGAEKRTLTILANLRNSFHSNGMYTNADLRHEVRGLVFEFRRDERVICASWAHIVVAIHENLALLDRFFRSNLLNNVTDEIRDEFAGGNRIEIALTTGCTLKFGALALCATQVQVSRSVSL